MTAAGQIVGWGDNWAGQATPPQGSHFVAIAAGGLSSLALTQDGQIVAWGQTLRTQASPPPGNGFTAIAAEGFRGLALEAVCAFTLAGDLNNDCKVDLYDYAILAANWLAECITPLADPDCITDMDDLVNIAENWLINCNSTPSDPACVPN